MNQVSVHVGELVSSNARVEWDEDGHSVICEIDYKISPQINSEENLGKLLERQFNIREKNYVINAGMLSMLFDSEKRLWKFDIYTNPVRWTQCAFPFVEAIPATLHIEAAFDETGHGESIGEPAEFYEPLRGTLYLSWADASTWYALAPLVAIGVANDNSLAQIRLDGLHVQTTDQKATGLWGKLRHRFGFR